MPNLPAAIVIGLLLAAGDPQRDAAQLVQQGLDHFRDDQFADAESAFAQALEIVPENDIVLFDQGCAALSAGKRDEARSLLRSATLSKQPSLAAKAHYNLGSLESTAARELLGDEPEAAEGETRTESIALLQASIQQFRSTLQRQPNHAAARHNLELIRLYIKHLQSQWAERDKEKNRDEKNLLQFLEMIEERQFALRTESQALVDAPSSAFASQAAYETADALRTLQEEIGPLKEKIASELQGQPSTAPSGQAPTGNGASETIDLLFATADRMGEQLLAAADRLESRQTTESVAAQTTGLARTNELYTAIAPYTAVLQRAIQTQSELLPPEQEESGESVSADTDPPAATPRRMAEDDAVGQDANGQDAQTDTTEPANSVAAEQMESQQRVALWSTALPYKAEAELPQITAQLEQLPETPEPPAGTAPPGAPASVSGPPGQPDSQQQREQLEGLMKSMNLAIELAPQAASEAELALGCLQQKSDAEPHQSLTLKILEEIAEPLKDDPGQDNDQQDQNDQNEDQDDQDENQDDGNSNEDDNKDDNGQKDQQDEQSPSENQPQDKKEDPKQDESSSREQQDQQARRQRAESILRQAAEREREHREQQKRIRALLQRAMKVDRDW
ncbi:MAG: hypothetical protein NXI04_14370 [Planctomycetaceae bacterium]|nr:hypothetical protein [Planctomycetaceae bacterium]